MTLAFNSDLVNNGQQQKESYAKEPDNSIRRFPRPIYAGECIKYFLQAIAKAGNDTGKGTFPARVQSAATTNANKGATGDAPATTGAVKGGRKSPSKGTRK
ncbi:hypothetical protein J3R30DRAFT_3702575 [Lentinula aciculospora]|uniref:Uncharacterized protein n=1 Tax=Lentinula aciculospora TaxID=153920 RepID=A0A9W9AD61_9AGAR|nr:hypothetical protein J3R30DRAFT_3702575 [Lentinula aciculospora]